MLHFDEIYATAAHRKGGTASLEKLLPKARSPRALRATGNDRYLAAMTRCVFRAGFVWRVVQDKWPGFENAFAGFDPDAVRHYSDEALEALAANPDIVRNLTKIRATRDNAAFVARIADEHGSFGAFLAASPPGDVVSLWRELKRGGARLGGNSGPFFLREVGYDTFLLTDDVVASLVSQRIVARRPTSQRDLALTQEAFNTWHAQSGRPLCQLSRILSFTTGDNVVH
ncbi:MAG: DNA-3-methyladenine glycosylase I [Pseudomonadota bacterium]